MQTEQCTELFGKVFHSGTGGLVRDCSCGRVHFHDDETEDFDEGELEQLREKAKEQPDKYIPQGWTIETMEISGCDIVFGCTCDTARKYERFIVNHDTQLAKYLNARARELKDHAAAIEVKS